VSNISPRRPALNIPLLALWAASIGVAVLGSTLLQRGNAELAAFYTAGGSDYQQFLGLQSQGTIGGMLLTAGVVGGFIALATHARNRAARLVAASAIDDAASEADRMDDVLYIEDIDDVDDTTDAATRPEAPAAASTADAPVPATEAESTPLEPAAVRG
jgi:hypothetical protein